MQKERFQKTKEDIKKNELPPFSVLLKTPEGETQVLLQYTTDWAYNGCQGFVRPGLLLIDSKKTPIQIKKFYTESFDDKGYVFSQNPQREAESSYEAFVLLRSLGFQTPPFFGLAINCDSEKLLIMTDLSDQGSLEVYDEKHIRRRRNVGVNVGGKEIIKNAKEVIDNLSNKGCVLLDLTRSELLSCAHGVTLGFGVAHMIVVDQASNLGQVYVVDVGEAGQANSEYKKVVDFESLIKTPTEEILNIYRKLLQIHHPKLNAEKLYTKYLKSNSRKAEFQNLVYKAMVGLSLDKKLGGLIGQEEFARRKFVRNNFPDHFMRVKFIFDQMVENYQNLTGQSLFEMTQEAYDKFINSTREENLFRGIDFSYLAAIDSIIYYLIGTRDLVDRNQPTADHKPSINFDEKGFIRMCFFDNYDESNGPTTELVIRPSPFGMLKDKNISMNVEFSWSDAYEIETSCSCNGGAFFQPKQIKSLYIGGKLIEDFDPAKIAVASFFPINHLNVDGHYFFIYDDETMIYEGIIENGTQAQRLEPYIKKPTPEGVFSAEKNKKGK